MPIFTHNNIATYYEQHGKGQPLVLISGYTCDHTIWKTILDSLTPHFQVTLFDNRAIGQTQDDNKAFTIETMANDTIALIENLGLKKPHIVGQSMGGEIVQTIAYKCPDKIGKAVTVNSQTLLKSPVIMALETSLQLRKAGVALDLLLDTIMPWVFGSDFLDNPDNIQAFKNVIINNPFPQSVGDQERQMQALRHFDSRPWVKQIKTPMLVIASRDDIISPVALSEDLAQQVSGAKLQVIPGGHSGPIEAPKELSAALLTFLA